MPLVWVVSHTSSYQILVLKAPSGFGLHHAVHSSPRVLREGTSGTRLRGKEEGREKKILFPIKALNLKVFCDVRE